MSSELDVQDYRALFTLDCHCYAKQLLGLVDTCCKFFRGKMLDFLALEILS